MSLLPPHIQSIPPSGIRRFFDIVASMDDVISLGIGEPDFVTPRAVMDAAVTSLAARKTGYTSNAGLIELREAIAEHLFNLYGYQVHVDQILITVGASEAMQLAMLSLLSPGDEVLIPEPCFVSYAPVAQFAHGKVVFVPTSAEHDFEVTAENIESRITSETRMIFIGYPNNPTGAILSHKTLQQIANIAEAHNLILVSDEIYDQLIYGSAKEKGHVSAWSVESLRERSVILGGFSKAYAMTGWRLGYVVAPPAIYDGMYKVHQYMIMSAPTMSQYGALSAINHCALDVERMRQAYDKRRRMLVDSLRSAGLPTFEPEGAFYCFPDIRATGLSSEKFAEKLIHEESVAVVPGDAFGPSGAGFVRCSYATADDKVIEAGRRITRFAQKMITANDFSSV